jgi:hypothetical protein
VRSTLGPKVLNGQRFGGQVVCDRQLRRMIGQHHPFVGGLCWQFLPKSLCSGCRGSVALGPDFSSRSGGWVARLTQKVLLTWDDAGV